MKGQKAVIDWDVDDLNLSKASEYLFSEGLENTLRQMIISMKRNYNFEWGEITKEFVFQSDFI